MASEVIIGMQISTQISLLFPMDYVTDDFYMILNVFLSLNGEYSIFRSAESNVMSNCQPLFSFKVITGDIKRFV